MTRLRFMSYNIKSGLFHPDGLEAIARAVADYGPDVLALQEVDRCTRRSEGTDQTAWLAARLGMEHHVFGPATHWEDGGEYGVALISRFPFEETRVKRLWIPEGDGPATGLREPRVVLSARLDTPAGRLVAMVTHLGLNTEQRVRQAEGVVAELPRDGTPVVLMGDLNGRPESDEVRLVASTLHDVMGHLPEAERITFPSGDLAELGEEVLARTIDYIFVTEGLEVEEATVLPDLAMASDHNPLVATLVLGSA